MGSGSGSRIIWLGSVSRCCGRTWRRQTISAVAIGSALLLVDDFLSLLVVGFGRQHGSGRLRGFGGTFWSTCWATRAAHRRRFDGSHSGRAPCSEGGK